LWRPHRAYVDRFQALLQRRLLLQADGLGALAHRLLLDLHSVERCLDVSVAIHAVRARPALNLPVSVNEHALANTARSPLQIAVAALPVAVVHQGTGPVVTPAELRAGDSVRDLDRWQSLAYVARHVALVVYARQFREAVLIRLLRLLASIDVLHVARVLQVWTHALQ